MNDESKAPPEKAMSGSKASLGQLERLLDEYLVKKAPALPKDIKEFLVNFAPWITLVAVVLLVPAILGYLGMGMYALPVAYAVGVRAGYLYTVGMVFLVITLVLRVLALPGLFKRARGAWNLMFYSVLVSAVHSLLSYSFVSLIVGTLLALYCLFQVKSYYH